MNDKSKTMLAIIAVALMVGTALVPLAGVSGEDVDDDSSIETNQATLGDIINAVKNIKSTGNALIFKNYVLVPVEASGFTEATIPDLITTTIHITSSKKLSLGSENGPTYTFGKNDVSMNGRIIVDEGACIVLWPNEQSSFSLVNKNVKGDPEYQNVVKLMSGSYLSIFGVTFKVLCGGSSTERFSANLFTMTRGMTATFGTGITTGPDGEKITDFTLKVTGDKPYRWIRILEVMDAFIGTDMSIKGQYKQSTQDGTTTVSFSDFTIDITLVDGTYGYVLKTNGSEKNDGTPSSITVTLTPSTETENDSAIYNCTITSAIVINLGVFEYNSVDEKTGDTYPIFSMDDVSLSYDKLKVQLDNTVTDTGEFEREVTTTTTVSWDENSTKDIKLEASDFSIYTTESLLGPTVSITDLSVTFSDLVLTLETKIDKTNIRNVDDINCSMGIDVSMAKIEVKLLEVALTTTDSVSFSIGSLSVGLDGTHKNVVKTTVDSFGFKAKFVADKLIMTSSFLLDVDVTNITSLYYVETQKETSSFDLVADLSTTFDGMDRHAIIKIDTFAMTTTSKVTTEEIGKITLTNDIPFSKIISVASDAICTFEAKGITLKEASSGIIKLHGESLSFESSTNCGLCDRYGMSATDFDLIFTPAKESENYNISISSVTINGFLKDLGADKEPFSITGTSDAPAKISVHYAADSDSYRFGINNGEAIFGKGFLPFTLSVGENVTFRAGGLSAMNFIFNSSASVSGTIVIDLADKLSCSRSIRIGDANAVKIVPTVKGKYNDLGGYVLTFNLASKSGTIVAHDGWTLNSNPSKWTLVDSTHATFDFKTMELSNVTSSEFYFSIQGGERTLVYYGQEIDLSKYEVQTKTGREFVGWYDGEKIYNADAIYVMPARTVVMEPIYAEIVSPTPVKGESGTVIVSTTDYNSTAVAVKANEIEGKDKVIIEVKGATVVMDKTTVKAVTEQAGTASDKVVLSVQKVEEVHDSIAKNIVGENMLFNINLSVGGKTLSYSEDTTFKVTLNVDVERKVEGFAVSYMDDTYHTTSVNVESFEQNGRNAYDVTFTVNHFSDYIIEPIYGDEPWPESGDSVVNVILGVLTAAVILFCGYIILVAKRTKE